VQKHVRPAIVGNDEAVALRCIEPFDNAADFDEVGGGIAKARERIDRGITLGAA
jgi:hypothetical protein